MRESCCQSVGKLPGGIGSRTASEPICPGGSTAPLQGVVAVAAGTDHSLALRNDGSVWAWGYNGSGQLGNGNTTDQATAVLVVGPTGSGTFGKATAVAAGQSHSVALKDDGTVWAWGYGGSGQLGNGSSSTSSYTPAEVSNVYGMVEIASGTNAYHTLGLRSDGTLFAWGANGDGQLGTTSEGGTPYYPVQVVGIGTPHSQPTTASLGYLGGVTNIAAGITGEALDHEEVLAAGQAAATRMGRLLRDFVGRL